MKFYSNKKGFTLVELMVVIVIIVMLTRIVLSSFNSAKAKSRDAKRISDMAQIQLALELYFDRCNQYPKQISNTSAINGCPSTSPATNLGTFISKIPTIPTPLAASDHPDYATGYWVNSKTSPTDYRLETVLELNNSVLVDSNHDVQTNYYRNGQDPAVTWDCTYGSTLFYCVVPK